MLSKELVFYNADLDFLVQVVDDLVFGLHLDYGFVLYVHGAHGVLDGAKTLVKVVDRGGYACDHHSF